MQTHGSVDMDLMCLEILDICICACFSWHNSSRPGNPLVAQHQDDPTETGATPHNEISILIMESLLETPYWLHYC
jgi:hypothetical protein